MRPPSSHQNSAARSSGIALLVVMVVFIVLYLVVYHLNYWTMMEQQVAQIRSSDSLAHDGMHSVSLFILSLLLEDLKQDLMEAQESGGGGLTGGPLTGGGLTRPPAGGGTAGPAGEESASNMVPLTSPRARPSLPQHIDYARENIFNEIRQSIGEVEVKAQIHDNEGRLDLNRLFELAALVVRGASGDDEVEGVTEEELAGAVGEAADDEEAADNLRSLTTDRRGGRDARRAGSGVSRRRAGEGLEEAETEIDEQLGLADDLELAEFVPPDPEIVQAAREIVGRAVEAMASMNEDMGYFYETNYSPSEIADDIVDYVLARRSAEAQNVIYHPSELLNIYSVTPELYYGSQPEMENGEYFHEDGFVLRRDEFGDLVAEYVEYDSEYLAEMEYRQSRLEDLQEMAQQPFMDFPGLGLGRLGASALTRGMSEPPILYDEEMDEEYVLESPLPLGFEDIFCTFSVGKININTAPVPVLYSLLLSLSDGPDGDANFVAVAINDYRNRLQPIEGGEEGVEDVSNVRALGRPTREPPPEEELDEFGNPLDPMDLEYLPDAGSAYKDLETNYFTNLQQLELVDGTDETDPKNRLKPEVESVAENEVLTKRRVGREQRYSDEGLLQRVLNDYGNVMGKLMVPGSTYFTVELKARTKASPLVKRGYLVVKRDKDSRLMEVILWKEHQ